MGRFSNVAFSQKHWCRPPQCVCVLLTFLLTLLMILWKFECINLQLKFSSAGSYSSEIVEAHRQKPSDRDIRCSYDIVETVKPAIAWRSVLFKVLPHSSNNVKTGKSTFWGKATHKFEIIALNIQHLADDVYEVEFKPSFGGLYEIEIFLTYVNEEQFTQYTRHVRARMVNVTGSPFSLLVQGRAQPKGISRYCSQFESGTSQGRWVKCGALRDIERCSKWQIITKFDFDNLHGYFWLPYACQLHFYTNSEMKTCLARNGWERIVFTGDSHSRFRTYHWATRLYGACPKCGKNHVKTEFDHVPKMEWIFDARGTRWPATFPNVVRVPNEIYIHPKTRRSHFSYALPNSTFNGDLYFMNFGHWILREKNFAAFMNGKIAAFLQAVKLMNRTGGTSDSGIEITRNGWLAKRKVDISKSTTEKPKKFIWVNSLSLKWREDKHVVDWTMTPSPSTIGYLNSLLDKAMKEAGIQVVDAFQISNPRLSAIHDATHYAKLFPDDICGGVVENAVTNAILNTLCNEK